MSATFLISLAAQIAIVAAMSIGAAVDVVRRIIPNETVLVVAIGGLLIRLLTPNEPALWLSIAAALTLLICLGLIGHRGFLGGGDIKMIAAASLAVPLRDVLPMLLHVAIAGGVVALFYLLRAVAASRSSPVIRNGSVGARQLDLGASIPYGVAILLGVLSLHIERAFQCSVADFCWL